MKRTILPSLMVFVMAVTSAQDLTSKQYANSLIFHTELQSDFKDMDGDGIDDYLFKGLSGFYYKHAIAQNHFGEIITIADIRLEHRKDPTTLFDMEGDGDFDAAFYNNETQALHVREQVATNIFETSIYDLGDLGEVRGLCAADLDGDLEYEYYITDYENEDIYVFKDVGGVMTLSTFMEDIYNPVLITSYIDARGPYLVLFSGTGGLRRIESEGGQGIIKGQTGSSDPVYCYEVADINEDGLDDLIFGAQFDAYITYTEADGAFAPRERIADVYNSYEAEIIDISQDGDLDVVFNNASRSFLSIAENDGNQNFIFRELELNVRSVPFVIKDLNSDGKFDAVVDGYRYDDVLENSQKGEPITFNAIELHPSMPFDFDGDDDLDFIVRDRIQNSYYIYVNQAGIFEMTQEFNWDTGNSLGVPVDYDQDGDLDFLYNRNNDFHLLRSDNGHFTAVNGIGSISGPLDWNANTVADFDGDGIMDLVATAEDDTKRWIKGLNIGFEFGNLRTLYNHTASEDIIHRDQPVDFDNDGDLDLIVGGGLGELGLLVNEGNGIFSGEMKQLADLFFAAKSTELIDANNDGLMDVLILVLQSNSTSALYLFQNNGNNSVLQHPPITEDEVAWAYDLAVTDINGDGHDDISLVEESGNRMLWYFNIGENQFSKPFTAFEIPEPRWHHIGNMDSDSDNEIILVSNDENDLHVLNHEIGDRYFMFEIVQQSCNIQGTLIDSLDDIITFTIQAIGYNTLGNSYSVSFNNVAIDSIFSYGKQVKFSIDRNLLQESNEFKLTDLGSLNSQIFEVNNVQPCLEEGPLADLHALMRFYESTNGSNWSSSSSSSWKSLYERYIDNDTIEVNEYCDLPGVRCNDEYRVMELILVNKNIRGTLPVEMGYLTRMEKLDLSRNRILSIHEEFGSLSNLRYLDLSNNFFSGTLEHFVGLSSLDTLLLDENDLEGPIPSEFGDYGNLKYFSAPNQRLSGALPASMSHLVNLEYLDLQNNQLSGQLPIDLAQVDNDNLYYINMSENVFTGCIPLSYSVFCDLPTFNITGVDSLIDSEAFCIDQTNACGQDQDGDGYSGPEDCNDLNPAISPAASEIPFNNIDENCDGEILLECDYYNYLDEYTSADKFEIALPICYKNYYYLPQASFGINEISAPCVGIENQNFKTVWVRFTIYEAGSLTFSIYPIFYDDHIDANFIVYKLQDFQDITTAKPIRCMFAGSGLDDECNYHTGLSFLETDTIEYPGCLENNNHYLAGINAKAGDHYAIQMVFDQGSFPESELFICGTALLSQDDDICEMELFHVDFDGDGYGYHEDCNDVDPSIHPGAEEILDNDIDENCDGILGYSAVQNEKEQSKVLLSPMPVISELRLIESVYQFEGIKIYSTQGFLLDEAHIGRDQLYDMTELPAGLYIIELEASSLNYPVRRTVLKI